MPQITCRNVSLAYDGRTAVSGLSFSVNSGDYLCIVGENGSGKTTLIKALLGLKASADGTITAGDGLTACQIGYLPQQTQIQKDFPASVFEVVLSGRLNSLGWHPFYSKADKADAESKLALMNLIELKNRCYHDLSGGQMQRVLLARALCAAKKILLLDEPVTGLDVNAAAQMYESVRRIHKELGMTIIMVSHDITGALPYATHVLHLGDTKQLFFGTAAEYRCSSAAKRLMPQGEIL